MTSVAARNAPGPSDGVRYAAFGLGFRSAWSLPFAPLPAGAKVDVVVRTGEVPTALPAAAADHETWQATPGALLLRAAGVARFVVRGGREIVVAPEGGSAAAVGGALSGPVVAALLKQRGVTTLHAAAVALPTGGAALLLGGSAFGKSSLAAALLDRGCRLLADDIAAVVQHGGEICALPAFGALRLWPDALAKLGWEARARSRVSDAVEKYLVPVPDAFATEPAAVRLCLRLADARGRAAGPPALTPRTPAERFRILQRFVYRKFVPTAAAARLESFRVLAALAQRVPMIHAERPLFRFPVQELADAVMQDLAAEAGAGRGEAATVVAGKEAPASAAGCAPGTAPTGGSRIPARGSQARGASPAAPRAAGGFVWLASYPKSGSTWFRALLTGYLRGEPPAINDLVGESLATREVFNEYVGLDSSELSASELLRQRVVLHRLLAKALRRPAFQKVHEAFLPVAPDPAGEGGPGWLFERAVSFGAIYMVRNPLDVAVSYAHHRNTSVPAAIAWMNDGAAAEGRLAGGIHPALPAPMGTWCQHVHGWLEQREIPTHLIRYEDMAADPTATFHAALAFLDRRCPALVERPDRNAAVAAAVAGAAFSRLQAQEAAEGFAAKQPTAESFFRAGVAGNWRDVLTAGQVAEIVAAHAPAMERLGYLAEAEAFLRGA